MIAKGVSLRGAPWWRRALHDVRLNKWLYLFALPGIVSYIVFGYLPMYGVLAAFTKYDIVKGLAGSKWVGFDNFVKFFHSTSFELLMRNTVCISLLKMLFGFPAPILLALLFNEVRSRTFKRVTQTLSYLPYFLSWAVAAGIWMEILSLNGPVNQLLMALGLVDEGIIWFGKPEYFWAIVVGTDVWKNVGFGTVLYLAALTSVNPELYESAVIDGANRAQLMLHISLPAMAPVIIVQLILMMPGILNAGFDQILIMKTPLVNDVARIIDTYVYEQGIVNGDYTMATTVGLFKSVVGLIMLVLSNFVIGRVSGERVL